MAAASFSWRRLAADVGTSARASACAGSQRSQELDSAGPPPPRADTANQRRPRTAQGEGKVSEPPFDSPFELLPPSIPHPGALPAVDLLLLAHSS